jgi:hypothetical protein
VTTLSCHAYAADYPLIEPEDKEDEEFADAEEEWS